MHSYNYMWILQCTGLYLRWAELGEVFSDDVTHTSLHRHQTKHTDFTHTALAVAIASDESGYDLRELGLEVVGVPTVYYLMCECGCECAWGNGVPGGGGDSMYKINVCRVPNTNRVHKIYVIAVVHEFLVAFKNKNKQKELYDFYYTAITLTTGYKYICTCM